MANSAYGVIVSSFLDFVVMFLGGGNGSITAYLTYNIYT